ncbi:MAG: cytochrome P450 [Caldilinea sp. CFX5]|nr:cytochrome P450 [Caldilinea sp. CFX5]
MTNSLHDGQTQVAGAAQTLPFPPGVDDTLATRWQRIRAMQQDLLAYMVDTPKQYGDIYYFHLGNTRTYLVSHPDMIRDVLINQSDTFLRSSVTLRLLMPLIGNGLVASEGEYWRKQRKLIQPAFHHKRIAAYAVQMAEQTEALLEQWQAGQTLDVAEEMMKLTQNIVTATLFGASMGDAYAQIGAAIKSAQQAMIALSKLVLPIPLWAPIPANLQLRRAVRKLDELVLPIIQARRHSGEDKGDLLSMLLLSKAEDGTGAMTDQEVHNETMTLFIAGHETSANVLTWALYQLSQNPDVETKLLDELQTVLQGRTPTVDEVNQLVYTEMVIKETMRLYPPTWINSREAMTETTLGGYRIAKGSLVVFSPYVVHHDSRWFDQPERFLPERFTGDFEKDLPRGAYLPFGLGPHTCIGNTFAMMEMKIALATILQRYRFTLSPGHPVELDALVVLRPRYGMKMQVSTR